MNELSAALLDMVAAYNRLQAAMEAHPEYVGAEHGYVEARCKPGDNHHLIIQGLILEGVGFRSDDNGRTFYLAPSPKE